MASRPVDGQRRDGDVLHRVPSAAGSLTDHNTVSSEIRATIARLVKSHTASPDGFELETFGCPKVAGRTLSGAKGTRTPTNSSRNTV